MKSSLDDSKIAEMKADIAAQREVTAAALSRHKKFIKKMDKTVDAHRRMTGMVFQHFNLFNNLSVIDNITLAP